MQEFQKYRLNWLRLKLKLFPILNRCCTFYHQNVIIFTFSDNSRKILNSKLWTDIQVSTDFKYGGDILLFKIWKTVLGETHIYAVVYYAFPWRWENQFAGTCPKWHEPVVGNKLYQTKFFIQVPCRLKNTKFVTKISVLFHLTNMQNLCQKQYPYLSAFHIRIQKLYALTNYTACVLLQAQFN